MSMAYTDIHTGRRERTRRKLFSAFFHNMLIVVVPLLTFFFSFYFITSEKDDRMKRIQEKLLLTSYMHEKHEDSLIKLFLSLLLQIQKKNLWCFWFLLYHRQQYLVLPSLSIKQNAQRRRNICAQIYLYFFSLLYEIFEIKKISTKM